MRRLHGVIRNIQFVTTGLQCVGLPPSALLNTDSRTPMVKEQRQRSRVQRRSVGQCLTTRLILHFNDDRGRSNETRLTVPIANNRPFRCLVNYWVLRIEANK